MRCQQIDCKIDNNKERNGQQQGKKWTTKQEFEPVPFKLNLLQLINK